MARKIFCHLIRPLRKAFDSVPHRTLLENLKACNINEYIILRWLFSKASVSCHGWKHGLAILMQVKDKCMSGGPALPQKRKYSELESNA